tara:strand:+ start:14 stop:208 length:195 start_codon:yes stop_codon:yes gene_type:complete
MFHRKGGEMPDINPMLEIIKEIDISKYQQKEYRNIVDEIATQFKSQWYDELYDKKGWRDNGGES